MMPLIWFEHRSEGAGWIEALEKRLCLASVAQSLVMADFNADGITDIVSTRAGARGGLNFLQGNGDGTFQKGVAIGGVGFARGASVATADFNNDGAPDLAVYGGAGLGQLAKTKPRPVNGGLFTLLNNGNGTFAQATQVKNKTINTGGKANGRVVTGDFNADSNADILVTSNAFKTSFASAITTGALGTTTTTTPTTGTATGTTTGTGGSSVLNPSGGTNLFNSSSSSVLGTTSSTTNPFAPGAFGATTTGGGTGAIVTPAVQQQDIAFLVPGNGDGTFNTARRISLA